MSRAHNPCRFGKHVAAVCRFLRDEMQARDLRITQGKHVKLRWAMPDGRQGRTVIASTPGDRDNCADNAIKAIRRELEMGGVRA